MMLPLATEERTQNGKISLPMFITVWDRRRADSLILNINTARVVWGTALDYSASALCQSVWRGQTLREEKGALVQQSAFNWGHALHNFLQRSKTVDAAGERLIQLLAFPAQWKWQHLFSLSNKQFKKKTNIKTQLSAKAKTLPVMSRSITGSFHNVSGDTISRLFSSQRRQKQWSSIRSWVPLGGKLEVQAKSLHRSSSAEQMLNDNHQAGL